MKIAYIDPIVHTDISNTYRYYDGLFNALLEHNDCILFESFKDVSFKVKEFDVVVFGLGWKNFDYSKEIEKCSIPKIGFIFKPQNIFEQKIKFFKDHRFSLLLTSLPNFKEYEMLCEVRCDLFGYAANPDIFYSNGSREYEIGFSGALHQNKHYRAGSFDTQDIRKQIQEFLLSRKDVHSFLNGSDSVSPRIKQETEYASKIRASKMWLATPAAFGDITPRYFEVPMSGTVLFCSSVPDAYRDIFRHEETCIDFGNSIGSFKESFEKYRYNEKLLKQISDLSAKEFKHINSWSSRAKDFVKKVGEILK